MRQKVVEPAEAAAVDSASGPVLVLVFAAGQIRCGSLAHQMRFGLLCSGLSASCSVGGGGVVANVASLCRLPLKLEHMST